MLPVPARQVLSRLGILTAGNKDRASRSFKAKDEGRRIREAAN